MFLNKITYALIFTLLSCNISTASEFISQNPYNKFPTYESKIHKIDLSVNSCKKYIVYENRHVKIKICQDLFLSNYNNNNPDIVLLKYIDRNQSTSGDIIFENSDDWIKDQYSKIDRTSTFEEQTKVRKDIRDMHTKKFGYDMYRKSNLKKLIADILTTGNVDIYNKGNNISITHIYCEEYSFQTAPPNREGGRDFCFENGNIFFSVTDRVP